MQGNEERGTDRRADFDGRIVLVSGSSGIGLATGLHLAGRGARVHLVGNDAGRNAAASDAAGDLPVQVHAGDVTDMADVERLVEAVSGEGLDALVNAAGIQRHGTIESTTLEDWRAVLAVNLDGLFHLSRAVYPHLKARGGGAIVHVASNQGHACLRDHLAYATSKGAVHAFTRAMAVDAAHDGIRVNSVSPGPIRTPLLEQAVGREGPSGGSALEEAMAKAAGDVPLGRIGTAEEVAELIALLLDERAAFATGADFLIDGGLLAELLPVRAGVPGETTRTTR